MVQSESFPTPAGFTLPPCNAAGVEFIEGIHCSLELKSIEDEGNFFAGRDSGRAMNARETYDDEADYVKHSRRKAWTPWKDKIYKQYRLVRESQVVRRRGAIVLKKTQLLAAVGRMHTDIADDTLQASRQRTFRRAAGKVPGYGGEDAREDCNYQLSNKEKKENEEVSIRVLF